jgi:ABC-type branched-subunit amino acid transport system substrate-binding protein/serine/threonine protein kinase
MRCPRCTFMGEAQQNICPRCGYQIYASSGSLRIQIAGTRLSNPAALNEITFMRGDSMKKGRYRIIEEAILPKNQQMHGPAWIATDIQSARRRVLIRKVLFSGNFSEEPYQAIPIIVARLTTLSQHPGFPSVIDVFEEQASYYLVLSHPTGESLATVMQRQGGALPERDIAEYGRQLCEMLVMLGSQRPPLVHGAISPETIIVNSLTRQISLIYLPLFSPMPLSKDEASSGYVAPEQVRGEVRPSSDLYAIAAIMHHAVTGFDPRERLIHFYPPARRLNPLVTPDMEAILSRSLRLSAAQRYSSPSEVQQELSRLVKSYPAVSATSAPASRPLDTTELARRNSRNNTRNLAIMVVATVVILSLALFPIWLSNSALVTNPANATATIQAQTAALNQAIGQERQSFQAKGIGVSDGRLNFDLYPGRNNVDLKKQAATAIQNGDMSTAVNMLSQAVNADPIDGEAQIYNENIHLLQNNAAYATIVLGLPIDGSDEFLGSARGEMATAYLAQREINTKNLLPNGLKLRILIANSGGDKNNVATVAQFIADRVSKAGNLDHIIAVVGWPYSSQTLNARDILAGVHLPLVAPTASSTKLSGSSPYFFRVNPSDDLQGSTLGTLVAKNSTTKKILVLRDQNDSYSNSLAEAFADSVIQRGASILKGAFTSNTTTVVEYEQMVTDAVSADADSIFIAGFNIDGIRLAHAVGNLVRASPDNALLANLKVVGGDSMGASVILGDGNNSDAAIARDYPQDIQRLMFASFANVNEWNFLGVTKDQQPTFFSDWASTYDGSALTKNAPSPGYEALLVYDAVRVIARATQLISGALSGEGVRESLTKIGKGTVAPYQGITGRIWFDDKGNPVDKAIVVLKVVSNGSGGNKIVIQEIIGTFR